LCPCLAEIEPGDWGWQVEEKGEERRKGKKKEGRKIGERNYLFF
jgi:hypothetical protein